jgi:uncharacterized repeat protein (TIGR04052 family)
MAASAGAAGLLGTAGVAAAGVGAAGVGAAGVGAGAAGAKAAGAGGVSGAGGAKGAGAGGTVVGAGQVAVTIRFKATVGGADFACGQNYMGQGSAGTTVTPQDFRMFVQDMKLIRADGTEVPVQYDKRAPWQSETVALLDFENGSGRCAGEGNPEMNTTITGTVAAGEYTKISFVNGVPDDLNHADPLTLPEPLSKYSALSWSWLIGYRFIKLELAQVSTAGLAFGLGLVHTGNNGSLINRNKIVLSGFDAATSTIAVDAGAVFKGADLSMDWQCHSVESECDPMFKALGINFQTGLPLTTQSAFSVQ